MYTYKVHEVIRVVDGDTVDIIIDLGFDIYSKQRVNVAGIDAPESRTRNLDEKRYGLEATQFAERWFLENSDDLVVRIERESSGKFGGFTGYFYSGDVCFNEAIVDAGLAWHCDGSGKDHKDLSKLGA